MGFKPAGLQVRPGELKCHIVGSSFVSIVLVFPLKVVGGMVMLIVAGGNPWLLPLSDCPAAADLYTYGRRFI